MTAHVREIDLTQCAAQHNEQHEWRLAHLRRMGFTPGWKPTYNVELYGDRVLIAIPDIGGDDFTWLCNKLAHMYRSVEDNCVDNFRMCRGPCHSKEYADAFDRGCCGFVDKVVHNAKTGNDFLVGCNYGH
jgi:hypothetical protein